MLILHGLTDATDVRSNQPVLCASCHDLPPLDRPSGATSAATPGGPHQPVQPQRIVPRMSRVMHEHHGRLLNDQGSPSSPPGGDALSTCYPCHPGAITESLRGAMKSGGMECLPCHGDMLAVGGAFPLEPGGSLDGQNDLGPRRPWQDLPRCQSCHTGDALPHLSGPGYVPAADVIRLRQARRTGDPAANDNVAAMQLQGHTGSITECAACHAPGTLARTMNGPHGMHNVDQMNVIDGGHDDSCEQNHAGCRACHGANLLGTALSRAAADRSWSHDGHTWTVAEGTPIGGIPCHSLPGSGCDDD